VLARLPQRVGPAGSDAGDESVHVCVRAERVGQVHTAAAGGSPGGRAAEDAGDADLGALALRRSSVFFFLFFLCVSGALILVLVQALNDKSSLVVRESAAASIIAAQLVLQDETHLFTLLDGLADEKKNLLTYLFEKHSVRAAGSSAATAKLGMDRLVKEMNRLDNRTSTPPRPVAAA
jgi:hypothetical protein